MKLIQRFIRYMIPSIDPKIQRDIDRRSLHNIFLISWGVICFELLALVLFLSSGISHEDHHAFVRLSSIGYCIALCAFSVFLSRRMLRQEDFPHSRFFIFKIFFFVAFTVWAIFVDYHRFHTGEQIMSFYTVNMIMACFIIFRPWIGALLIGSAFLGLFIPLYAFNGAAGIDPLNLVVFTLSSIAANAILCHAQIRISSKAIRLIENNRALETASHRDPLTGLQNRLALEDDASKADGRKMAAYMIDINYFKEFNDQFGHTAGDTVLREVGKALQHLFPAAHYYRYGGDEFLVLTYKPAEDNYGANTFDFGLEKNGMRVVLSIGNAQGSPASYQEVFELISKADKALYVTKQRTHSVEFGGHDRRKSREGMPKNGE